MANRKPWMPTLWEGPDATKLLERTIEAIVIERPHPTADALQYLCLDKGYDNPTGLEEEA